MNIDLNNNNNQIVITLEGWLDTVSSPELGKKIDEINAASSIVLDFDKVEYIASSGVRQIIYCYKKAKELGADFSIDNVNSEIMSIIKMTGIDKKMQFNPK